MSGEMRDDYDYECSDCEDNPEGCLSDGTWLCFDCLEKRYEALRNATARGPETRAVLDDIASKLQKVEDVEKDCNKAWVSVYIKDRVAFLDEQDTKS